MNFSENSGCFFLADSGTIECILFYGCDFLAIFRANHAGFCFGVKRAIGLAVHRNDDVEEKWVVASVGVTFTNEEIKKQIHFQEQYFDSEIMM